MQDLSKKVSALLRKKNLKLATAESCTGGLLSATITALPGSSDVFERGFITYSNESKTELLQVPAKLIATHGAVSAEVAQAMAEGALKNSRADITISITGIAGPDGGSTEKPVGTVYIGYAVKGRKAESRHNLFKGTREEIRKQSMTAALEIILENLL
ncbi:MAG TPA: damage-inducible protein CinA [Rhodospirillaceae bacterium]|nr:damage-inducible protein CinA [Rhodospirillaceae bacterium]